jgi:hypothetical protein
VVPATRQARAPAILTLARKTIEVFMALKIMTPADTISAGVNDFVSA